MYLCEFALHHSLIFFVTFHLMILCRSSFHIYAAFHPQLSFLFESYSRVLLPQYLGLSVVTLEKLLAAQSVVIKKILFSRSSSLACHKSSISHAWWGIYYVFRFSQVREFSAYRTCWDSNNDSMVNSKSFLVDRLYGDRHLYLFNLKYMPAATCTSF